MAVIIVHDARPFNACYLLHGDPLEQTLRDNGYPIAPNGSTVTATLQAAQPGTASNVVAGLLTVLTSAIPGVDQVVNLQPINNAQDAETDHGLADARRGVQEARTALDKGDYPAAGASASAAIAQLSAVTRDFEAVGAPAARRRR